MNFRLLLLTILILQVTGCRQDQSEELPFFISNDYTPIWPAESGESKADMHKVKDFEFTDQNGEMVNNETFTNKIYVTDFFFTTCPSICPTLTKNMMQLQDAFAKDDDILLLSHTVMPWVDTVEKLNAYAEGYGIKYGKYFLATGDEEKIYDMARTAYFADEEFGFTADESDFLHTEKFILVDKERHIRGIYSGIVESDVGRLMLDIRTLQKEY